jgi:hypothetical protein
VSLPYWWIRAINLWMQYQDFGSYVQAWRLQLPAAVLELQAWCCTNLSAAMSGHLLWRFTNTNVLLTLSWSWHGSRAQACSMLPREAAPKQCVCDRFHRTFNFKLKCEHDVFITEMNVNRHPHFLLKCHLNVTCLVVHVILIPNVSIDVWFFSSQVTLHVTF